MRLTIFQQVDGAVEIVLHQLPAAGLAVHPGEHAGVGCGINDPVGGRQRGHIRRAAYVYMLHANAGTLEFQPVQLASWPDEIIKAKHLRARRALFEPDGNRAAYETANAADENFHNQLFFREEIRQRQLFGNASCVDFLQNTL